MQVFAQRYCQCNRDIVAKLRDPETIFVMAFAIIMLNTDQHTASMNQEKRMKPQDFIKNLRGMKFLQANSKIIIIFTIDKKSHKFLDCFNSRELI